MINSLGFTFSPKNKETRAKDMARYFPTRASQFWWHFVEWWSWKNISTFLVQLSVFTVEKTEVERGKIFIEGHRTVKAELALEPISPNYQLKVLNLLGSCQ